MTTFDSTEACVLCGRTSAHIPLTTWRYQGRSLAICPQCTPTLIHDTEQALAQVPDIQAPIDTKAGGTDAPR